MSWLAEHLETFVKPVLGYVPTQPTGYTRFFSPQEMSVIKNMWRSAKCAARDLNKPILLAGRDVFVFEILARREGYPTTFRPDISRLTVKHVAEDYTNYFLFDTGFMGSISKGLGIEHYTMASSNRAGNLGLDSFSYLRRKRTHSIITEDVLQVFPRLKGARSLALKIERTPKYWKTAYWRGPCACIWRKIRLSGSGASPLDESYEDPYGKQVCRICDLRIHEEEAGIKQEFSDKSEFLRAAHLTIEVYTDSSPRFTEGQLPAYLGI